MKIDLLTSQQGNISISQGLILVNSQLAKKDSSAISSIYSHHR